MTLIVTRVEALFSLFGLTMLAGLGPVTLFGLWKRKQEKVIFLGRSNLERSRTESKVGSSKSAKILQLLLVFGGGVLMSTCFVHLIPEIRESYDDYLERIEHSHGEEETSATLSSLEVSTVSIVDDNQNGIYYHPVHHGHEGGEESGHKVPWVEICICVGLFLTYFIEESVLLLIGRESTHHHHHHHHHHSHSHHHQENCSVIGHHETHSTMEIAGYSQTVDTPHTGDYGTIRQSISSSNNGLGKFTSTGKHIEANLKTGYDNLAVAVDLRGDVLSATSGQHINGNGNQHVHGHSKSVWGRFLQGMVVVIAFLAHSIFDGIAIGLQTTSYSIWTMFFAICLHKLVVVFAIGFELFEKTGSLILTTIHMTIFSSMSPLGIFLTIIIDKGLSGEDSLTLILLNAVATGAILYIVFLEILQADRCPEVNGLVQLVALVAGFILMTCMTVLVDHHD